MEEARAVAVRKTRARGRAPHLGQARRGVGQRWLPSARLRRGQRHIGAFARWKEHDACRKVLERLLRDLKVGTAGQAPAA